MEDVYDMEKELGKGAFGTVYQARNKALGYRRAVKKVVKGDKAQVDELMREIYALMDLDHPNIVKLIRYFDDGPNIYLVFELCDGPDLFDRFNEVFCAGKVFTEKEAADILRQMVQALKCCHH